jgi:hypothetical protein
VEGAGEVIERSLPTLRKRRYSGFGFCRGDSFNQANSPTAFRIINAKVNLCVGRRVRDRLLEHQEIGAHLGNSEDVPVNPQLHANVR